MLSDKMVITTGGIASGMCATSAASANRPATGRMCTA